MLISEKGLVRAIKHAYKREGYTVSNQGDYVAIYTESWFVKCSRKALPRKALALIVEHLGDTPDAGCPVQITGSEDAQQLMEAVATEDMEKWCGGQGNNAVTMVPVIMNGLQIFQPLGGGPCYGMQMLQLDLIDRAAAGNFEALVVDAERLLWKVENEAVVVNVVRKAVSGWAKDRERDVWAAMEKMDLHEEGRYA